MITWIKQKWQEYRRRAIRKKRLAALKKQDPFIYD